MIVNFKSWKVNFHIAQKLDGKCINKPKKIQSKHI